VFIPVSSIISQVVSTSSWKAAAGSVKCSHQGLACLSFIQKRILATLGNKSARVFLVLKRAAGVTDHRQTKGKIPCGKKKRLANKTGKNLGKQSMLPAQKWRAQVRGPQTMGKKANKAIIAGKGKVIRFGRKTRCEDEVTCKVDFKGLE